MARRTSTGESPRAAAGPLPSARTRRAAPPFADDYLPALLLRASSAVAASFHRDLRAHGLTVAEWRVLATLSAGEPMSTGRVAEVAVMKPPTATRLLDRLQAAGYVQRLAHASDRRVTLVQLTPAGVRETAALLRLARTHEQRVLQALGTARADALRQVLAELIAPGSGGVG